MKWVKNILPWAVAVGIFAYLFRIYEPHQIWAALSYVNLSIFVPFTFVYFLIVYFADIFVLSTVFKRFGHNVSVKELIPVRGVTYLLMILNYAASQGAFAYYLKKTHKIPIAEALSTFFFVALVDLYWIVTLAFIGSFFQNVIVEGYNVSTLVKFLAVGAYGAFFVSHYFWNRPWRPIRWLRSKSLFKTFAEASLKDYLWIASLRTPIHCTILVAFYILIQTFNAYIPFIKILGNVPLVFLVGVLPITPGGLGTTNAAMVHLLAPHTSGPLFQMSGVTPAELILAASLLWMFANYLFKIITGMICLKKVSRDLFHVPEEGQNLPSVDTLAP